MFLAAAHPELDLQPGWNIAMVFSLDGETVDDEGSSDGISNREDRSTLNYLRSQADLIVTTGATAVAENYRESKHAPIAVITSGASDLATVPALTEAGTYKNFVIGTVGNAVSAALSNVPAQNIFPTASLTEAFEMVESLVEAETTGAIIYEGGVMTSNALLRLRPNTKVIATVAGASENDSDSLVSCVLAHFSNELKGRAHTVIFGEKNAYLVWP